MRSALCSTPVIDRLAHRFVGGETVEEAVAAAAELATRGARASVHLRDDAVRGPADVAHHLAAYAGLGAALAAASLPAPEISVKLEQLGYLSDGLDRAVESLAALVETAATTGVLVTVDMEGADEVEDTLTAVREVRGSHPSLGVAVQAYLPRTETDCVALAAAGARVRLCKGGYPVRRGLTWASRHEIDLAYVRCLRTLMADGAYPMVASHDDRLVDIATALASRYGRGRDEYEMQLLLGVRPDLVEQLLAAGRCVRVYVPFGPEWYCWVVNRITEKPSTLRLLTG